ncbi:hypothetical protein DCAR_0417923 [Daucus carota subsp. sativus]|uniref:Uncharacterized protein n=1 Tax=Daucus carota subsp. sativus TaxID=79200 RepID=A0AAF1AXQ2_DAUCS|nr:hypothetical protein DCAR_0417923 [Daucus carota subsp. sativus]
MTGYDSNGYSYPGPRVSNVQPYLQSNVESVTHGNLNNKLSRLSLGVQGTKPKNMKKKGKKGGGGGYEEVKKWPAISENEWPCNPVPEPTVGWPELNLKPAAERVLTEEENALLVAGKAQQKALDAATDMFREMMDSDGEIEDSSSDDDDDYEGGGGMDDEKDECKEYKFFSEVFAEDSELRSYYEKNCERGEFSCLVCAGLGQKVGKKYKDCVALVQHSTTIAKTKKRRAHRALGEVICKVLGPHDAEDVEEEEIHDGANLVLTYIIPHLQMYNGICWPSKDNKTYSYNILFLLLRTWRLEPAGHWPHTYSDHDFTTFISISYNTKTKNCSLYQNASSNTITYEYIRNNL